MSRRHDTLWKGLLQAYFSEFVEFAVPAVAAQLRLDQRRFLEQESFTDPPQGRKALLDVVAEVPARDGPDRVALIHVEVERAFSTAMDQRMWRYFAHLSLKFEHPVVPIVLFLRGGRGRLSKRRFEHKIGGFLVNRYSYWAVGLSGYGAKSLLERAPLGVALASCARGDRLPRHEQKLLCMEALLQSQADDAKTHLLLTAIETYLTLNEEQKMKYAERVSGNSQQAEIRKMELTWAGKLHERGRQEGQLQGSAMMGRRMLRNILSNRFGSLPESLNQRILQLEEPQQIESICERALVAADLSEVEALLR